MQAVTVLQAEATASCRAATCLLLQLLEFFNQTTLTFKIEPDNHYGHHA